MRIIYGTVSGYRRIILSVGHGAGLGCGGVGAVAVASTLIPLI